MNAFLWAMLAAFVLTIGRQLIWLATGQFPTRTPETTAWSLAINAALAGWAIYLLTSRSAQ